MFGICPYGIKGKSVHVYEIYTHDTQVTEDYKSSEMEALRQSRQKIRESTKWGHFEIVCTNIDHAALTFTEENSPNKRPPNHRTPLAPVVGGR